MKKILVVSCTQLPKSEKCNLKIYESLHMLKDEIQLKIHFSNREPLAKIYNQYINEKTHQKHDIVVFAHDDLFIDDLKIKGKLDLASNGLDIIGLAGCLNPKIKSPALWHLMADQKDWRGCVAHPYGNEEGCIHFSSFGPTPSRVAMIDGVFMAVKLETALYNGFQFNENFEFHHYDLSSCIDANKLHMKIGVIPIHAIHASPGLRSLDDKNFKKSEEKFLELYGK